MALCLLHGHVMRYIRQPAGSTLAAIDTTCHSKSGTKGAWNTSHIWCARVIGRACCATRRFTRVPDARLFPTCLWMCCSRPNGAPVFYDVARRARGPVTAWQV